MMEELQKVVQISESVVSNQQSFQELEFLDTENVFERIVLAVNLLDSEIGGNVVQIV